LASGAQDLIAARVSIGDLDLCVEPKTDPTSCLLGC